MPSVQDDMKFGDLAVQYRFARGQEVQECLAIRKEYEFKGQQRSLREVLLEKGYISYAQAEVLQQILDKLLMECRKCGALFNLTHHETQKKYTCKFCDAPLGQPSQESAQAAVEAVPPPPSCAAPVSRAPSRTPDRTVNLVGQKLGGCVLFEKIATGGMGTIYKAKQTSMNRIVAVKVLFEQLSHDKAFVKRFVQEARAAGALAHGNIVQVIDVGEQDGIFYFIMEYIEGENLDILLRVQGKFPVRRVLDISRQIADALSYAHARGVIHRDIKPANIIITRDKRVKLADLGIAKKLSASSAGATDPGTIVGTANYMPPEQVRDSSSVDQRSDIYSLGASMYHLMTGHVPFPGESSIEVIAKMLESQAPYVRKLNPDIPEYVACIVHRAIEKDVSLRYQKMSDLTRDIDAYLRGEKIRWIDERIKQRSALGPSRVEPPAAEKEDAGEAAPPREGAPSPEKKATRAKHAPSAQMAPRKRPHGKRVAVSPHASQAPTTVERKKQQEKWAVVAFVIFAFLILGAALIYWSSIQKPSESDERRDAWNDIEPPPEDTGQVYYTRVDVEADAAFKKMQNFERNNPYSYDELIKGYREISSIYKNTRWGNEAARKAQELTALKQELDAQLEKLRGEAAQAKSSHSYGGAMGSMDAFMEKCSGGTHCDETRKIRADLLDHAQKTFNDGRVEAQKLTEQGRLQKAVEIYRSMLNLGIPELDDEALLRVSDLSEALWQKKTEIWPAYENAFTEEVVQFVENLEYEEALKVLDEVKERKDFQYLADDIELDRQSLLTLVALYRSADAGIRSRIGEVETITSRGVKMTGTLRLDEENNILIEAKGFPNPPKLDTKYLAFEDALRFARLVLPEVDPTRELAIAANHLLAGRLGDAEAALWKAAERGADVESSIRKVEMREVQRRLGDWQSLFDINDRLEQYWKPASESGEWMVDYRFGAIKGSSQRQSLLIQQRAIPSLCYILTLKARKEKGVNGFLISFSFGRKFLYWAIGHEENTTSTIVGLEKTTIPFTIQNERWYHIRIVVLQDKAIGYLNHDLVWRIRLEDVAEALDAKQMGLGTVATDVLYKDIRINIMK